MEGCTATILRTTFGDIRGISNEVSREHGLSVIESDGKGKSYDDWSAEKSGTRTSWKHIRADLDAALPHAADFPGLLAALEAQGYAVKYGPNVKHAAVKPPGRDRFARLDSLGAGYTEADLVERIAAIARGEGPAPEPARNPTPEPTVYKPLPPIKYYRVRGRLPARRGRKLHGIRALYVKYLFLLGFIPRRKPSKGAAFLLREDTAKLDRHVAQFKLMLHYRIDTAAQLDTLAGAFQAELDSLTDHRKGLYRQQRQGLENSEAIAAATAQLKALRKNLTLCTQAQADLAHIRTPQTPPRSQKPTPKKEVKKHVKNPRYRPR